STLTMLRDTYMVQLQSLTNVQVLSREERDARLDAAGITVMGEINQRAADKLVAGTRIMCHITAGARLTDDWSKMEFQVSLDDADPTTPPLQLVEVQSSLVDAEMVQAIEQLVQQLNSSKR